MKALLEPDLRARDGASGQMTPAARSRPLRVVFFNRSYYPDYGATGQLLTELCEDLVARFGYDVTVVAGMPTSAETAIDPMSWYAPVRREQRNGVKILRAWSTSKPTRKFTNRLSNYFSYLTSSAAATIRLGRPDVIVSLTDPPVVSLTAIAAAKVTGAKFVFLCQDVFPEVARLLEDFHNPTVENVLTKIGRFTVKTADRVIALGDTMKRRLVETKNANPDKIRVIHNWSDAELIQPGPKNNAFARQHDLVDKFVVMHSGNVGMSQDVDALLDIAELLKDLPDVVVAIVGEGARKAFLQDEARRRQLTNVRFLPYQPKAGLGESFATADVFIVSLKRGLAGFIVPSKLYGILAAGRPYVAAIESDSEAAQIAREHDCGIVVDPGDRAAMAGAIRQLYQNRSLRERLAGNARTAGLIYDRSHAVENYRRLFEDVVDPIRVRPIAPAKRALDVIVSGLGLLASAPIWGALAAMIKIEDGGPIFFSQERVGEGGRLFLALKFRSMVPDAEAKVGALQASANDPRVTKIGRLMRATAMDELPQLWNIFRGDMSFVGPRALRPGEIETGGNGRQVAMEDIPGYHERHSVRPGLTGIAQIFAPRDVPRRHKFKYDQIYVRQGGFALDVKLILLSFWITFRGKWEHRGRKF